MLQGVQTQVKAKIDTILFLVLSLQGVFLLTFLSKLEEGTHADPSAVCWYFFQNCFEWLYIPAPGTSISFLIYALLVSLNVGACIVAAKGYVRHAVLLSLPLSIWVAQHIFIASYSAGHAYDYIYLVLFASFCVTTLSSRSSSVFVLVAAAHIMSALYMTILVLTGYSAVGKPYAGGYTLLSQLLSIAPIIVGLSFVFFFCDVTKYTLRIVATSALLLYIYSAFMLSLEWRYTIIIAPYLIAMFVVSEPLSLKKNNVYIIAIVCLVVGAQVFQGMRTITQGGMCLRPHLGIATAYNEAQCISMTQWTDSDGVEKEQVFKTPKNRPCWCDPYVRWYKAKQACLRTHNGNISWSLYTSVRNERATLIAQTDDLCATSFRIFGRQDWQKN